MKFTGQQKDGSTTGLDFFNARYLSGAQGRFTSADPGNAGASLGDPQSWNGYAYVNNNPLNLTDPSGMDAGGFAFCGGGPIACGIGIGIDVGLALWKIFGGGGQSTPVTIPRNGPELWNERSPVGLNTGSVMGGCGTNAICNFEKLEKVGSLGPNPALNLSFPSIRSKGQTFKACMAQHANLYSIGGSAEASINLATGTQTSYSDNKVVNFFGSNALTGIFYGSSADNAATAANNAPGIIAEAMGRPTTYGRRTTSILSLNLAG